MVHSEYDRYTKTANTVTDDSQTLTNIDRNQRFTLTILFGLITSSNRLAFFKRRQFYFIVCNDKHSLFRVGINVAFFVTQKCHRLTHILLLFSLTITILFIVVILKMETIF